MELIFLSYTNVLYLALIVFLPLVAESGADHFSRVLDDHFTGVNISLAE